MFAILCQQFPLRGVSSLVGVGRSARMRYFLIDMWLVHSISARFFPCDLKGRPTMPNKFVCDQLGSLVGLEEGVCIVGVGDWLAVAVRLVLGS